MRFCLTFWTTDPDLAVSAEAAGVDRIGVDLEVMGKASRQSGLSSWISDHTLADLVRLKSLVRRASLFARTNPLHSGSGEEIEAVLETGATVLMIPNFTELEVLAEYVRLVNGRAKVVPLVERVAAVDLIPGFPALGVTDFHVGLNDLSLDLGLPHRFLTLFDPCVEKIAAHARELNLQWGLGGLGRTDDPRLPVPSQLIYAQHARLGSTGALLARCYFADIPGGSSLEREIQSTRQQIEYWKMAPRYQLMEAHATLREKLARLEVIS